MSGFFGSPNPEDAPLANAQEVLRKRRQEPASGWTISPFSEAADRISYAISSVPLPWLEEYGSDYQLHHNRHFEDERCSICKAWAAPGALRIVVDAVLDAALADPEIASELAVLAAHMAERNTTNVGAPANPTRRGGAL